MIYLFIIQLFFGQEAHIGPFHVQVKAANDFHIGIEPWAAPLPKGYKWGPMTHFDYILMIPPLKSKYR